MKREPDSQAAAFRRSAGGRCTHRAAVVNESSQVPTFCRIYDGVLINPEQIAAADALLLILLLPQVGDDLEKHDAEDEDVVNFPHCGILEVLLGLGPRAATSPQLTIAGAVLIGY